MAKRGRPPGSTIALLKDPGRFQIAGWLAFTELGFGVYPAARLVAFLASDRPITTGSIEDVSLISTVATRHADVNVHADNFMRKAKKVIARIRANEQQHRWLCASVDLIKATVKLSAAGNRIAVALILDQMRQADWAETLDHIGKRMEASLRTNFPPSEGPLSRTANRLLREAKKIDGLN